MKGFKSLLIGNFLAFGLLSSAYADLPHPFGWYVEGNLGKSYVSDKFYGNNVNVKNTGRAFSLAGGYKFTRYFAAEVGYTQYAKVRLRTPAPTTIGNVKVWSADIAGKGILPIWQSGFEIFAKAGLGYINTYTTLSDPTTAAASGIQLNTGVHSTLGMYFGAGLDYAMTQNLIANIQWMRQRGRRNTGDGILASAGLAWIF